MQQLPSVLSDSSISTDYRKLFSREVVFWRVMQSILWTIFCEFLYTVLFVIVVNLDVFHPISWIQSALLSLMSLSTWGFFIVLASVIFGLGVIISSKFVSTVPFYGTRFTLLYSLFLPRNIFLAALLMTLGGLIVELYLSLLGGPFAILVKRPENGTEYLGEEHLFLLMCGMWTGLYYYLQEYVFRQYCHCIKFPIIQQPKVVQIKYGMVSGLKTGIWKGMFPPLYFSVLYYWKSQLTRADVFGTWGWKMSDVPMDFVFGIMNIKLLIYAWIFSSCFFLTMDTLKLCFQVYLTEHCVFPVYTVLKDINCVKLADAMANVDFPILYYLGYFDFLKLAEQNPVRRQEVFILSHPGGHPHNWNGIVKNFITLLSSFNEQLQRAHEADVAALSETIGSAVKQKPLPLPAELVSRRHLSPNIRSLTQEWGSENVRQNNTQKKTLFSHLKFTAIADLLKEKIFSFWNWLRKKPGFSYFFSELPGSRGRRLFYNSQPIIWACQAMSSLIAASFKEDEYGVVQKDLPSILTKMLELKSTLEKHRGVKSTLEKHRGNSHKKSELEYDMLMKTYLKSSVKRGLYKICAVFGEHILAVPLPKKTKGQLQIFLDFKEG